MSEEAVQPVLDVLASELERLRASEDQLRVENENLREALLELEQARDAYFELYDLAVVPLLQLDRNGIIRNINVAATGLFGRGRSALLGHMLHSFAEPTDRVAINQHLLSCQQREVADYVHFRLAGGAPARLRARYAQGANGPMILAVVFDDSENARAAMERKVLVEAEQRARLASESKDNFIAMLSHELRTPLTPILAICSMLKDDATLEPKLREVFARLSRNADAEARLIDDLLDATGIMRGKIKVVMSSIDVHELLTEAVDALLPDVSRKRQHLELQLGAKHAWVAGDPLRLRQIFVNLLRNAIKFTPELGDVCVRTWNGGDTLRVEVEDTGIGFAPESTRRIFEPFDQLDEETRAGGLGLGLAIAKGLVELHDGKIEAASRGPGKGARFVVELPVLRGPIEPQRSEPCATTVAQMPRSEARLLLVEDNPDTAEVLAELLSLTGYAVVVADSMRSALEKDEPNIGVIISDLGLPDGSGIELIQKLQSTKRRPAIALSGFGMEGDIQACKAAGFDMHLTKPVTAKRLIEAIQALTS